MKSVLISIQPKGCEFITSGEKTIEVRKTKPKLEIPFKVHIYCTKDNSFAEKTLRGFDDKGKAIYYKANKGKVIGEFVCDRITEYDCDRVFSEYCVKGYIGAYVPLREMCLTQKDLMEYGKGKTLYGWHISDLKIYDKPKELGEFWTIKCTNKRNGCLGCEVKPNCIKTITRPPQSWCRIEGL